MEALASGGITLKEKTSQTPGEKEIFGCQKNVFFEILDEVKTLLDPRPNFPNYRFLLVEKKLAITLSYLKDTGSLWMTANTFGIHQFTVSKTIVEVCKAINAILGPDYLHLPRSEMI